MHTSSILRVPISVSLSHIAWLLALATGFYAQASCYAAEDTSGQRAAPRVPTGKPWIDMDYGPSLTLTLEAGRDNFAYKGVAIRLDAGPGGISQGSEFAVFDTDTLRYAASWLGPQFIDWRCIHFNGDHAVHPRSQGAMLFQNPPGPGWARPGTGSFEEERLVGRDGRRYGPLDRPWAHWKGHYHHGNRVILSYTVGSTDVLESPSVVEHDQMDAFARTLNVGPREHDLIVQIAHGPSARIEPRSFGEEPNRRGYVMLMDDNGALSGDDVNDIDRSDNVTDNAGAQPDSHITLNGVTAGVVGDGDAFDLANQDFTIWATVQTNQDGTIFAKAPPTGTWQPGAKALFIRGGQLAYDVGWVGVVQTDLEEPLTDGKFHAVAMTFTHTTNRVQLFVDGKQVAQNVLATGEVQNDHVVKLGFASPNFPEPHSAYVGRLGEVRFYDRALDANGVADLKETEGPVEGVAARWSGVEDGAILDHAGGHHARLTAIEEEADPDGFQRAGAQPELGDVLCIGLVDGPAHGEWITTDDGHVRLKIPAGEDKLRLTVLYARVDNTDAAAQFETLLAASAPPEDLEPLTHGGPPKWSQTVSTSPSVIGDADGPYVAESITVPHDNPYRSWMRLGGFDFFDNGRRAAVCTWQGDVWIVDGIGSELDEDSTLTWRRIASGMFQPLGLKIVDGDIYVTCRDQITILRDFNGDGETDFYENFNNDHQVTDHFHEFAVGLQTDDDGNFYYAKCARHALDALVPHHGTLLKVSRDGSQTEIVARGYRAPNGVCLNNDGTFFLSDQEGHWTPKNRINWVKPGGFYGNMMAYHDGRDAEDFEPPVCWIHNNYDRSPAEQVWVASEKWGPLAGSLLTLSYGTGEMHVVLHEQVAGIMQGGLVRLPVADFPTGVMRGRFHPDDGQLYACGLFGWSSNKTSPGGFYRVRYTGKPLHLPVQLHASQDGLAVTFTEPLDETSATNDRNWSASRWQYRRTQNYGSEDYLVSTPGRRGRDRAAIEGIELSADKRTVHLKLRDMRPAMQMELRYQVKAADGTNLSQLIHHTVHKLDAAIQPRPEFGDERMPQRGLIAEYVQRTNGGVLRDAKTARLPAIFVPPGEPPTSLLQPGPFTVTFRGTMQAELPGSYTLGVAGRGKVTLRMDGEIVLRGEGDFSATQPATVDLHRDYVPIEITYQSPDEGGAEIRLDWEATTEHFSVNDAFAVEPTPPSLFWHDPDDPALTQPDRIRRGRELFATLNCIQCHELPGGWPRDGLAMPEMSRKNPDLAGVGSRLEQNWLYHWIADPAALRNHVTMPRVFGPDLDDAERQEVADLVAYLKTLQDDRQVPAERAGAADQETIRAGEILYEKLGCIACHRFTPPAEEDAYARTSLHSAGAKFRPGGLVAFLQVPHADYPSSRMPDFRLSIEEATHLAAYIRSRGRWMRLEDHISIEGNAPMGRDAFKNRGCLACHAIGGNTDATFARLPLAGGRLGGVDRGCLASSDARRGKAPTFSLTAEELDALAGFLSTGELGGQSLQQTVPVEASERLVARLRCAACHARDGRFSALSEVALEEGVQGLPIVGIPSLTWAGEKLQRNWLGELLDGRLAYRARPWLRARMPAFPAYSDPLAAGLPREHGFSGQRRPRPAFDEQAAQVGETLAQQFTGFYCTECHAAAGRPPTSAFDHRGIDFPYVTERLQYDYYHRWMRDPQRIDPGTKMPQFAKDPKPGVLDGNAHQQMDALWHYLESLQR